MKNLTFTGTDADLEISLFEQGLIVSNEEHKDGSGTHFVVYKQGNGFGCGHVSEEEIDGYVQEQTFMSNKDIGNFLDFTGLSKKNWLASDMVHKLSDLLFYWGPVNIMGSDYNPMSEQEVTERFL